MVGCRAVREVHAASLSEGTTIGVDEMLSSSKNWTRPTASHDASDKGMYSASIEELAAVVCLCAVHETHAYVGTHMPSHHHVNWYHHHDVVSHHGVKR